MTWYVCFFGYISDMSLSKLRSTPSILLPINLPSVPLTTMCPSPGMYEHLPVGNLPPLWLAYLADPSDSGESCDCSFPLLNPSTLSVPVLNPLFTSCLLILFRENPQQCQATLASRYDSDYGTVQESKGSNDLCVCSGDHEVIEAMQKFAELTDKAKYALLFSEVCYDQNLYAGLLLKARIMRGQRTN